MRTLTQAVTASPNKTHTFAFPLRPPASPAPCGAGWLAGWLSAAGTFSGTNTHTPQRQTPPFPIKSTESFGMVTNPPHQILEACPPRTTVLPAQGVARGRTGVSLLQGPGVKAPGLGTLFSLWIQVSQLSIQRLDVEDPRAFIQTELNWRRKLGHVWVRAIAPAACCGHLETLRPAPLPFPP